MSGLLKDFDIPSVASTSQEGQENRTLKVTLLSRGWRSSTDGDLSTINRELAIQLAKHSNVEVSVFLPQCSGEDRNNAASHHVQLVEAEKVIGWNPVDLLFNVPDGHVMDCVIGHGLSLGKHVQLIKKRHHCKWIQVVHTAPEELGMYKSISQCEKLQKSELELCKMADQIITIGPKLADAYKHYLHCSKKEQSVFDLTPSIFSEYLNVERAAEERTTFSVLVIGSGDSCEGFILKGFELAAQAVAELKDKSYILKFVGAPRGKEGEIADTLLQHGIGPNQLIIRSFSDSIEVLANLFCEVDLAIMPSKTEGFGVSALEPLSAGLPVLVSGNSGLGKALKKVPLGSQCVVDSEDPKEWAKKIKEVRHKEREVRLLESSLLREKYQEKYSWEGPIRSLVERMYSLVFVEKLDHQEVSCGMTALRLASCRGTYSDGSSLDNDKDIDSSGETMVLDLLSLAANYGSKTDWEETLLHLAARHSRADMAKRLLDYGADANARDRLNRTPLHLAIGADAQGVFQILLRNRTSDLEARMDDGTTPLILAARRDLADPVRHLIKAGVKVNSADNQGKTALHWAALVNSLDVTKELLKNGAKKDAQDEKGQTPLFLGCREGSVQTVGLLLVNCANRKVTNSMDVTPEDIAKQRHHQDIVELLRDWSLGCILPNVVPAPTSLPEGQNTPMVSIASPLATSPPAVEIPNGSAAAMVQQFHVAHLKAIVSRTPELRPRPSATGNNDNSNAKRKRKKARPERKYTRL